MANLKVWYAWGIEDNQLGYYGVIGSFIKIEEVK